MARPADHIDTPTWRQTLWLAWAYSRGVRLRVSLCCALGVVRIALGLGFVWVSKMLVDTATGAAAPDTTERIVGQSVLLASLMLSEMVMSLCTQYLSNQTEIRLKNTLRDTLYEHVLMARHSAVAGAHSADYVNRLTEDTRVLADAVTRKLPDCVVMCVQFLAAFVLLYAMSSQLAWCVVAVMPVFMLLSKVYVTRTRAITAEVRATDSRINTSVQEGIQHHVVVQTLEGEDVMRQRLGSLHGQLYGWTMKRTSVAVYSRAMMRLSFISCYLLAFIWSVWHLHTGAITYGVMTAFLQLVGRIQHPVASISQLLPALVHALTSIDRLRDLQVLPREEAGGNVVLRAPVGIRLDGVSYRYSPSAPYVLRDFSYDFAPASKTVIMGETGVGKSTLVRLVMALLQPEEGSISIYDSSVSMPVSRATRCNMVYVPQGNSLFDGTVRDNLLIADPEATEEMMREALHTAVASFVYDLPQGLDTPCGELGTQLSEGQAQRVAIARALLRKGSVLVLDEFNSALDASTAATLISRLTQQRRQSTIIFISHRPDVAAYCDNVLRLDVPAQP